MLDRMEDTIVAVSSAPGRSPLGIVRLSGPQAMDITARLTRLASGRPLHDIPGGRRVACELLLDDLTTVPAALLVFRAPRSYTRQDLLEMQTIGAPPLLAMVRRRATALGALPARPGEFTARAFLLGGMELTAAEAVAATIRARTEVQLRAARQMMDGTLAGRLRHARDLLGELLALVEADIDFAEEPIEFITPTDLRHRLEKIGTSIRNLLSSSLAVERIEELPRILLLGPPNAGKSLLMNRLSGGSRAISADLPGTTRDILTATIGLGRGEALLLDAAGIDDSPEEVLALARGHALAAAERVDLVCVVLDAARPATWDVLDQLTELELSAIVPVLNKCDLLSPQEIERLAQHLAERCEALGLTARPVPVSALTGAGIDALRMALAERLRQPETTGSESVMMTERQQAALGEAHAAVQRATQLAGSAPETADAGDVLAFELREALEALGQVTGDVTTEDLLGRIFANFCIGK